MKFQNLDFWLQNKGSLQKIKPLFCDKCQTSSDPTPPSCDKKPPTFFTRKTLSEEFKTYSLFCTLLYTSKNSYNIFPSQKNAKNAT